jgi:hypothetical protein
MVYLILYTYDIYIYASQVEYVINYYHTIITLLILSYYSAAARKATLRTLALEALEDEEKDEPDEEEEDRYVVRSAVYVISSISLCVCHNLNPPIYIPHPNTRPPLLLPLHHTVLCILKKKEKERKEGLIHIHWIHSCMYPTTTQSQL